MRASISLPARIVLFLLRKFNNNKNSYSNFKPFSHVLPQTQSSPVRSFKAGFSFCHHFSVSPVRSLSVQCLRISLPLLILSILITSPNFNTLCKSSFLFGTVPLVTHLSNLSIFCHATDRTNPQISFQDRLKVPYPFCQ